MRIAFTHNLKSNDSEAEAEFDTLETIDRLTKLLQKIGHEVFQVEVSGPPARVLARIESLEPDLIFNTAEGTFGRFREGFYPALFEQMGFAFTGSDAYICNLTLDKDLSKSRVSRCGVPVVPSVFVTERDAVQVPKLKFPLFLKPNYEGSSKGITQESVVSSPQEYTTRIKALLKKYPEGILVEEFVDGFDVTVPFVEALSEKTKGVLCPVQYIFDESQLSGRKYQIYDYDLKNKNSDAVSVKVPADISQDTQKKIMEYAGRIIQGLGVRDLARMDFRISTSGEIFFIEINALPSLEEGAGLFDAAKYAGATNDEAVFEAVIQSCSQRFNLKKKKARLRPLSRLRVGFTYNEKRQMPGADPLTDTEAEFDAPKTLEAIRNAIRKHGHEVIDFEATSDLPAKLGSADVDLVFNIAEGIRGRNRESQVPALLDMMGIPYTGSDATTLAVTLDKALAKKVVAEAGVATPFSFLMHESKEKIPSGLVYPLMVKPVAEGSSKGIHSSSVVRSESELRLVAYTLIERYHQPALVETFVGGREFTVALLGEKRPKVLPPMEIIYLEKDLENPVYSYQYKLDFEKYIRYEMNPELTSKQKTQIETYARKAFMALGCRDLARIDFRMDLQGNPYFLECNPLPGLTPGWSDLCLITEASGMGYETLIQEILSPSIRRLKDRRKELSVGQRQNSVEINIERPCPQPTQSQTIGLK
jgi:D-alanine-D-alanine ligase